MKNGIRTDAPPRGDAQDSDLELARDDAERLIVAFSGISQSVTDALSVLTASTTQTLCYPWCAWKDNHSPEGACFGSEHHVDLSSYPAIEDHICPDGSCRAGADQLKVCGYAHATPAGARIAISHNVQPALGYFQVDLTSTEAHDLIAALQSALDGIGGAR